MTYNEWIHMVIENKMEPGSYLEFRNAQTDDGKFFLSGNMNQEVSGNDVDRLTSRPDYNAQIASCGREMALSGTGGSYDIYHGDAQFCHVYWCAPYLSGGKAFEISSVNGDYEVEDPRVDLANVTQSQSPFPEIGEVHIRVKKRGQESPDDEGSQENRYAPLPYDEI